MLSLAVRLVGAGAAGRGRWLWVVGLAFACPLLVLGVLISSLGGLAGQGSLGGAPGVAGFGPSAFALKDIPPAYLRIYQQAGADHGIDWTYLAAIGSIETNHGRSRAPGVRSGVNSYGCCAGPMQFMITGPNGGTWGAYGKGSVYDPRNAIPAAAKYLKASGAPDDMDKAIFAYNHAGWYVDKVKALAERYRGQAISEAGKLSGSDVSQALPAGGRWLAKVPGTRAVCDRRIVADVELLLKRGKMTAGDCFAMTGHARAGEHPLGLGIDMSASNGDWALVGQLARELGWRASCGATGCAGQLPSPWKFIGWNGYPGHGDPSHAGTNAHLHVSWQHTPSLPGHPAARVQTLLPRGG